MKDPVNFQTPNPSSMEREINPGIKKTVEWLQKNGFNTCDSGDGKTNDYECDQEVPYVHMQVKPEEMVQEAQRLLKLLLDQGFNLFSLLNHSENPHIEVSYNPVDALGIGAILSLWNFSDSHLLTNSTDE